MELQLSHCTIRKPTLQDAASFAKHANNPKIAANLRDGFPHPYTLENAIKWIEFANGGGDAILHIIEVNGEAAGGIGIHPFTDIYRMGAEIGYWVAEEYWGRGIASEAVKAIVHYAFENTPYIRLQAGVLEHNPASRSILEKAGFTLEGIRSKAVIKNNVIMDEYLYAILK